MEKLSHLKLLIILFFSLDRTQTTPCELFNHGTECTFNGVETNETNIYFNPSSTLNAAIVMVNFVDSMMLTLTDELCKAFNNLKILYIDNLLIEYITPGALHQCERLEAVFLENNLIETLDTDLFKMNPNMIHISLHSNLLTTIDGNMFQYVPHVKILYLGNNYLTDLPLHQFPNLMKLEIFSINENNLMDLNETKMIENFPKLNAIYLHNNIFDCNRLAIILKALQEKEVGIGYWNKEDEARNSNLTTMEGNECVPHQLLEILKDKHHKNFLFIVNMFLIGLILMLSAFLCVVSHKTWLEKASLRKMIIDTEYVERYHYEFTGFF